MVNNRLKEHIVETVDNQLRDNEPKCVKDTFEKLINLKVNILQMMIL
ncbi:hypothetical protein [Clostridium brassicae]|uniref:Uncharacterized protein n=1 Tax=Clostridium brassicae TaxID=2999072 RepID=A0ABT4DE12_9CLOT|nr:hypothetical protein [Clostridium brassicae]MCY6960551.1 hypothetical protein [Clostridium brassicae]